MIVKDEEAVLGRCLESARGIADEIIIVDTGSADGTKEIARRFTDRVFDFVWCDDFAKARNFSFAKAECDYIMWLDADDVISSADRKKIIALKKQLTKDGADIVTMRYNLAADAQGDVTHYSVRGRLFRRAANPTWYGEVHEYVPLSGSVFAVHDIAVTHKPERKGVSERNLKIYQKMLVRDGKLDARGKYYYARELKDHGRNDDAIRCFEEFLNEGGGGTEDSISACYNLALLYKMGAKPSRALYTMLRSFNYGAPRAEMCCLVGYHYKDSGDIKTAAAWFAYALNLPQNDARGFVQKDYDVFIPALELGVCHDAMGDIVMAYRMNEIAGAVKPRSAEYLHNKEYFLKKLYGG